MAEAEDGYAFCARPLAVLILARELERREWKDLADSVAAGARHWRRQDVGLYHRTRVADVPVLYCGSGDFKQLRS